MQKVIAGLILIAFCFTGLLPVEASSAFAQSIQIQFSHTHEHGHHDHSHNAFGIVGEDSSDLSQAQQHSSKEPSDSHSHTLVITASVAFDLPQRITYPVISRVQDTYPVLAETMPPAERSLGSIFRPPILA